MQLSSDQMLLGQLIDELLRHDLDQDIRYDFGYFYPHGIHSYRGFYEDLALGYDNKFKGDNHVKGGDVLSWLNNAINKEFTGYKGGKYRMNGYTPLWVANHDETSEVIIVDVQKFSVGIVLVTKMIDF